MIDWSFVIGFVGGVLTGINLAGIVYWAQVRRMRAADREFRAEQAKRLDELREWSARQYEQTRREIGLPPRSVS